MPLCTKNAGSNPGTAPESTSASATTDAKAVSEKSDVATDLAETCCCRSARNSPSVIIQASLHGMVDSNGDSAASWMLYVTSWMPGISVEGMILGKPSFTANASFFTSANN